MLRDSGAIAGLLVAAAGAAGLSAAAPPVVRVNGTEGVTVALWLGGTGGHALVHTFPERGLLLLDLLVPDELETERAVDVFVRRLNAKDVRRTRSPRG